MHELGLCEAIVDAIERRAADRSVARVRVRVGRLQHVHPDAFDQSFAMAAAGTVADGAAADLVFLPVRARCRACGNESEGDPAFTAPLTVCPECGGADMQMTGGDELILESIEYRASTPS